MKRLSLFAAVVLFAACHTPEPRPTEREVSVAAPARLAAPTAGCSTDSECPGGICEGQGCAPGEGRCVSNRRACTRDLVSYCGCDGVTFRASGTCPGRRYASRGPCAARGSDH